MLSEIELQSSKIKHRTTTEKNLISCPIISQDLYNKSEGAVSLLFGISRKLITWTVIIFYGSISLKARNVRWLG